MKRRRIKRSQEADADGPCSEHKHQHGGSGSGSGSAPYQEVVRNKRDRELLVGHDCPDCAKFYEQAKGIFGSQEARKLCQQNSRHRTNHVNKNPPTPEHFWSIPSLNTVYSQSQSPPSFRSQSSPKPEPL